MRRAEVFVRNVKAGTLTESDDKRQYEFRYDETYKGDPISLNLNVREQAYKFTFFPAFFEGLLPEGAQLDALLRQHKIDRNDHFTQLVAVGDDLVGAVQVRALNE